MSEFEQQDEFDDPTLVPDVEEKEEDSQFRWDEEFQRHIIAILLSDKNFLMQSMSLIRPSYFTNKAHQKLCSLLYKYFEKYRVIPNKTFLLQEIKTSLQDNKSLPYYLGEVNALTNYFQPGLEHRDYLQDKIKYFAKMQSFRKAFSNGLKVMEKNPESEDTWDEIYNMMRQAMLTNTDFEVGINYFKEIRERYERMEEEETGTERFMLGLDTIDGNTKGGGYGSNAVVAIVADSGVGKSVMLANICAKNLRRGKKGLYITLEISEDEVGERMDAILTGMPVQSLLNNKENVFQKLEEIQNSGDLAEGDMVYVVKQFPPKTADVNTLRAYINQLKYHDFKPDFMIVDYVAGLKHHPNMKTYESRELLMEELYALSVEENIFVATAMQPNRGSKEAQKEQSRHIGQEHLADAYGAMRPLTACIMLMQNDTEAKLNIGRGWVEKQRHGDSKYMIFIRFDRKTLRFTEITKEQYLEALSSRKAEVVTSIDDAMKPSVMTEEEKVAEVISPGGFTPAYDNGEAYDEQKEE